LTAQFFFLHKIRGSLLVDLRSALRSPERDGFHVPVLSEINDCWLTSQPRGCREIKKKIETQRVAAGQ